MTKEYIKELAALRKYVTLMDTETLEVIKSMIAEELTARKLLKKVREW